MTKTTLHIDGMMCGMCESHINDAIRRAFPVKKVTSSHKKGETVILSDAPLDAQELQRVITATGYTYQGMTTEPYEKKRFLFF